MFLVRTHSPSGRLKLVVATEADARANHPEIHRTKRNRAAERYGFREVEGTGRYRTDVVDLRLGRETSEDERGRRAADRYVSVSLRGGEVEKAVRRLQNDDAEPLILNRQAIDRALEEVERLRQERAELVQAAWQRARGTVDASELERLVERTKEAGPEKPRELTADEKASLKRDTELLNGFARRVLSGK
jgi:hypothetical protein